MAIEQLFETTSVEKISLKYLIAFPEGYDATADLRHPLLLFLHGMGERGDDPKLLYNNGLPKLIRQGKKLPFIIVMPQCPEDSFWTEESKALHLLLEQLKKEHRIDDTRIYITGLSMGAFGTYDMLSRYPHVFAAGIAICGGIGNMYTRFNLDRLKETPLWIFHGEKDPVVPARESKDIFSYLQSAGAKDVKLTLYEDLEHDSWTRTYANDEIYRFLLDRQKQTE